MINFSMKVSVIIPSYKPQSYILDCLSSLSKQTFDKESFEIVIVLNGCNEPYKTNIINMISSLESKLIIHILQTDVPGVSNARNIGLDFANGDYICFIDDDDFVSSTYLEQLYAHASGEVISLCRPLSFIDGTFNFKPYNITKDYDRWANNHSKIPFQKARRFFNGPV